MLSITQSRKTNTGPLQITISTHGNDYDHPSDQTIKQVDYTYIRYKRAHRPHKITILLTCSPKMS